MKVVIAVVGRPGRLLARPIAEYEARAARYWSLDIIEVKAEKARRGMSNSAVREAETRRLLERIEAPLRILALSRTGRPWSSAAYARELGELALHGQAGVAFLVGGALGLEQSLLPSGAGRVSLGPATLPHELARLVLTEQLYRAGTIIRGEPYHKG